MEKRVLARFSYYLQVCLFLSESNQLVGTHNISIYHVSAPKIIKGSQRTWTQLCWRFQNLVGEDAIEMSLMLRKDSYKISIRKKCTTTLFPSLLSFPIKNGQFRYISTCDKRLQEYANFFRLYIPYQSLAIFFWVCFSIRIYLFYFIHSLYKYSTLNYLFYIIFH